MERWLKKLAEASSRARELLISVFFIRKCFICDSEVDEGLFCKNCRNYLPHWYWLELNENLIGVNMIFCYEKQLKTIIHKIKFQKDKRLLKRLQQEWLNVWNEQHIKCSLQYKSKDILIVPIPTDQQRVTERGFDIPQELFEKWCYEAGFKWANILERVGRTVPQYGLTPLERWENLEGLFVLRNNIDLKGQEIILVDDIFTTGATMESAANVLKQHGAVKVSGLALCGSKENFVVKI